MINRLFQRPRICRITQSGMEERMNSLDETVSLVSELGVKKVNKSLKAQIVLGFIAGAMISLGYMAYIKCVATIDGGLGNVLGASIFPIGLLVILLAGGELITGNMTVIGTAYWTKKVTLSQLAKNWLVITLANIAGALFVALIVGTYLGTLSSYQDVINNLAQSKAHYDPLRTFVSGIICNWFVGLGVWLNIVMKDGAGKIMGIWFPVMVFVLLGFQHSVANVFLMGISMSYGGITISQFLSNFVFSYLGNIVGGAVFVGLFYVMANSHKK